MHIEGRITCYDQHHTAVLLWNGHFSTSPARSYIASSQSCQQLPVSLSFQKFGARASLFLPFLLQFFWMCMEHISWDTVGNFQFVGTQKLQNLQFPGPAQSGMNSKRQSTQTGAGTAPAGGAGTSEPHIQGTPVLWCERGAPRALPEQDNLLHKHPGDCSSSDREQS